VDQAFAAKGPFPVLLPPIAHELGIDIVLVHGWRPRNEPDFATVRSRLIESLVEGDLDQRSRTLLARLRAAAPMQQLPDGSIQIGAQVVAVREIEDAILQAHGQEMATRMLDDFLARLPWQKLPEDRPVLAGRGWGVERGVLIAKLLERGAAQVREDLIGIAVLRAAVETAGISVDTAMVDAEIERLRRAYRRSGEAVDRDFEAFVRNAYGASLADLRLDAAFRALTGCAELMRRQATPSDAEVAAYHVAHRADYHQEEAVDLALIFLPHLPADGKTLTEADRERSRNAAGQMHGLLTSSQATFSDIWERFGRRYDPLAVAGRIGWVPRSGQRGHASAKPVPAQVMLAAFAAPEPYPKILDPVPYDTGFCLVEVLGHRSAREPALTELIDQVRRDCLEADWDARLSTFVDALRQRTEVIYEDLPPLILARAKELGVDAREAGRPLPPDVEPVEPGALP
jgi:hypothetical protein